MCTYVPTDERARATRLQQLTLYQQQSGTTDGRAARLQHGQPTAVPSVGDDRRRERLDFSVIEHAAVLVNYEIFNYAYSMHMRMHVGIY